LRLIDYVVAKQIVPPNPHCIPYAGHTSG